MSTDTFDNIGVDKAFSSKPHKPVAPIFLEHQSEIGVLLLHSFTSTPYEMKELAEYLHDRGLTVYAPLIAGHGSTPEQLAKTTIEDWQESVEEAYLFLKQRIKKMYVIGSSFGGNLAFDLAMRHTNPLAGIVSMGTPIKVRWQKWFKAGLYTYGLFMRSQKKRRSAYQLSYHEFAQVVYPVMPMASLRRFFKVIRQTAENVKKISVPTLIIQSSSDKIVDPRSAQYLHSNLATDDKRILWMNGSTHTLAIDEKRELIFSTIHHFIFEN